MGRLDDGTYLTRIGALTLRVITAEITIATAAGRTTGVYRLVTTLTDPQQYPVLSLVRLYHQRWEIESCSAELKSTILGGRVLRAQSPAGIEQELFALLTAYQVLRIAMTDATDTATGTDPDRTGFTVALHTARDQLILAQGVIAETEIDLAGTIGQQVLAHLLPARRLRGKDRIVKKRPVSQSARLAACRSLSSIYPASNRIGSFWKHSGSRVCQLDAGNRTRPDGGSCTPTPILKSSSRSSPGCGLGTWSTGCRAWR